MKTAMAIVALFVAAQSSFCQEYNWHLKLANGDTLANVALQNLVGDSLAISHAGQTSLIAVESIVEMRKTGKSKLLNVLPFSQFSQRGRLRLASVALLEAGPATKIVKNITPYRLHKPRETCKV